jgi:cell wall-associated NlpC family hydrolase
MRTNHRISRLTLAAASGLVVPSLLLPMAGTVSAAPTAWTQLPNKASTYTVVGGDTLYTIARQLDVPLTELLAANDLQLDSLILPGRTLVVPRATGGTVKSVAAAPSGARSKTAAPAPARQLSYTVQSNDGLYTIAHRHGVSLTALREANDLEPDDVVHPGTVLVIPAGGRPPQALASPSSASTVTTGNAAISVSPAQTSGSVVSASAVQGATAAPPSSSRVDTVIAFARAQLGKPYRFAAAGPDAFDCSGLTTAAYRQVGVYLPQQSLMQSARGMAIDWHAESIRPGDLVFVNRSGTDFIGHVGIAISSTMWIHAPREGDVVRIGIIPRADRIQAVRRHLAP